jgi:EF-hand domain pair
MGWFKASKTPTTSKVYGSGGAGKQQHNPSAYSAPEMAERVNAPAAIAVVSEQTGDIIESHDMDDAEMVEIDRPKTRGGDVVLSYDYDGGVNETETKDTKDYEEEYAGRVHHIPEPQQNHLNSLFNGHLMKWKLEAEEGTSFIRVPAFFGSIALLVTAILALVLYPEAFTAHSIVMSVCVVVMSIFIAILDGRFMSMSPLSVRAQLRNVITRNFNVFRYVWGRALLYMVAGTLNVAQLWMITICSGSFMIALGFVALFVGIHASRKFAALRSSLADESFLLLVFSNFDADGDGYLTPDEFALLLTDLGMELDDRYTLKAFNVIDLDNDRRISFEEFNHWWASGYVERGRKRRNSEDDYHRME